MHADEEQRDPLLLCQRASWPTVGPVLDSRSMDATFLSDTQKNVIKIRAQMIRNADEEHAVRLLTTIVTNLARDRRVLDAVLDATKDEPLNEISHPTDPRL